MGWVFGFQQITREVGARGAALDPTAGGARAGSAVVYFFFLWDQSYPRWDFTTWTASQPHREDKSRFNLPMFDQQL